MKASDRYPALIREGVWCDMKSRPQDFDCFLSYLKRHHSDLQSVCPVSWHWALHCCCHSSLPPSVNMALSPQQPVNGPYVWRALLQESGLKSICPHVSSISPQSPNYYIQANLQPNSVASAGLSTCPVVSIPLFPALFVFKTHIKRRLKVQEIWQQKWIRAVSPKILDEKNISHFSPLIPVLVCQSGSERKDWCLSSVTAWVVWGHCFFLRSCRLFLSRVTTRQEEVPWLRVHFTQNTKENISCL